ncbi:MAG: putative lipid II flippase FtsW [Nocardioidaceae bacterium]|nr:putative lipid II flippase FtsW [Nocardioidaceae bacterium]
MTTTTPRRAPDTWVASLGRLLDRPLTSYQLVLGAAALLLALGLVMVLSASSVLSYTEYGNSYVIFGRQAMWVAIGLPAAWLVSRLPVGVIRAFAWPGLLLSVVLVGLTYVPGLGVSVNGNQNWIGLGPLTIQPSEVAKLAIVLWAADVYARKDRLLDDWRHLLVPVVPVTMLVALLVVGQRDLGTALVLFAIILGTLWVVGAPPKLFVGALLAAGGLVAFLASTDRERVERITTFLDPFSDFQGGGWQAAHGFFALASGQFFGVGIGASRQKWGTLPAAHTDFVFAVIGEELGLFGTLVVLALFALLAFAGFRIATRTTQPFVRYAAAGITLWLLAQALVNVGMVLGFLPVIGIPLPLVSYGGSALLPTLVALGMLLAFATTEPGAKAALDARRRRRGRLVGAWMGASLGAGASRVRGVLPHHRPARGRRR